MRTKLYLCKNGAVIFLLFQFLFSLNAYAKGLDKDLLLLRDQSQAIDVSRVKTNNSNSSDLRVLNASLIARQNIGSGDVNDSGFLNLGNERQRTPSDDIVPRIVGGDDIDINERSYQVSLLDPVFGHACGGALIAPEWVLTAAHCVFSSFDVLAGATNITTGEGVQIPVVQTIVHPEIDFSSLSNDFALVRLAEPAPAHLEFLPLADENIMAIAGNPGDSATVSGWGLLSTFGEVSDVLQAVDVPIVSNGTCDAAMALFFGEGTVTDVMICAGFEAGGKDSCNGDSGGPLTVNVGGQDYSVGVVSWGAGDCAAPESYGVYARTETARDWILEAMEQPLPTLTTIRNQELLENLSASTGQQLHYILEVPEDAAKLRVSIAGGVGDADLSVHFGDFPSSVNQICQPFLEGNEEVCDFSNTPSGYYPIVITAFNDFDGLSLEASYIPKMLERGVSTRPFSGREGEEIEFVFNLPADANNLSFDLSGGTGDADLTILYGDEPSEDFFDCASFNEGNEEHCLFDVAEVGDYFVTIAGFVDFEGTTLTANYDEVALAPAICRHVITRTGRKYFYGQVEIENVSDKVINGWAVQWSYSDHAKIKRLWGGQLSGKNPYAVEPFAFNTTIQPGEKVKLYLKGKKRSGSLANPTVLGDICRME